MILKPGLRLAIGFTSLPLREQFFSVSHSCDPPGLLGSASFLFSVHAGRVLHFFSTLLALPPAPSFAFFSPRRSCPFAEFALAASHADRSAPAPLPAGGCGLLAGAVHLLAARLSRAARSPELSPPDKEDGFGCSLSFPSRRAYAFPTPYFPFHGVVDPSV